LLNRLTSRQFRDWIEFYELEPWGSDMEFLRSGIVASTIANCHRDHRKPPFKPSDFIPEFAKNLRASVGQTMQETKSKMNEAMAFFKSKARKKKT